MDYYERHLFLIMMIGLSMLTVTAALMINICSGEMTDIEQFLINDTTDQHEYLPWYTCGHYARDLSRNASEHNLTIGSMILGDHPVFRGYQNHIMNYVVENSTIWVVEPQTDQIMTLQDTQYRYYRLYPNGYQVPSNWKYNLAHTGVIV